MGCPVIGSSIQRILGPHDMVFDATSQRDKGVYMSLSMVFGNGSL